MASPLGVGSSSTISGQGNFNYEYGDTPFFTGLIAVMSANSTTDVNVIYE